MFTEREYDLRNRERELIKKRVRELIDRGYSEREAMNYLYEKKLDMAALMDRLGLKRLCCRLTFQQDIVLAFPESTDVIAARIKRIYPELNDTNLPDQVIANFNRNLIPPSYDPSTSRKEPRESEEACSTSNDYTEIKVDGKVVLTDIVYVGGGLYAQRIVNRRYDAR